MQNDPVNQQSSEPTIKLMYLAKSFELAFAMIQSHDCEATLSRNIKYCIPFMSNTKQY